MQLNRRQFLAGTSALFAAAGSSFARGARGADSSRTGAMLMGSLIGDALGGPIEFLPPQRVREIMPDARSWADEKVLDDDVRRELADSLVMHPYVELRPDTAPYGPWVAKAERGTITDDSRHKIVLMRALRKMLAENRTVLTERDLAAELLAFQPHVDQSPDEKTAALVDEGLREYRYAARWVLGQRDVETALPPARLWAGVSNCSGQMALMPLAGIFPGQPARAYRATFEVDFIDAHQGRDIASAINAGLAAALDPQLDEATDQQRWQALFRAMSRTDPYRIEDVPWAKRDLERWLSMAETISRRSEGRPAKAYELLEEMGKPVYYWDAHYTLLVPLTMLHLCRNDPLAAMHVTLDYGRDTDSYAQVLGAMAGAVHGMDIFPESMSTAVETRLRADYGESVDDWIITLDAAAEVWRPAKNQE